MAKVILILVDGMRADCAAVDKCKSLKKVLEMGISTVNARTVFPSITLPCHMSLFHSVPPERHGILENSYKKFNHPVKGLVESLFDNGKTCSAFYSWEELRDLWRPGRGMTFSVFYSWEQLHETASLDTLLTDRFLEDYRKYNCDFTFLYMGETDETGHKYGWMSDEYLAAVENAAQNILRVVNAVPEEYVLMVTADHGGHMRYHGENIKEDMTIPFAIIGRDFLPGTKFEGDVSITDIAPTISAVLGVKPEKEWEGRVLG